MSMKKRLTAICVAMLTIPAFTKGDAPYKVRDIANPAYAISVEMETIPETNRVLEDVEGKRVYLYNMAEATTECGTTETTATEKMTTTCEETTTTFMTETARNAVATVVTALKTACMDVSAEKTMETETICKHENPTEPSQPESEITNETEFEVVIETVKLENEAVEEIAETETEAETEIVTETEVVEETVITGAAEFVWNGKKLTKRGGIVSSGETPSGLKETWYNLPMYGCLDLIGYSRDGYGETEEGFKTFNGYIMVASPDLSRWPKGSYIDTTNGRGIVVDFCPAGNLDIAVTW